MTLSALSSVSYSAQLNAQRLATLKSQFDTLSTQLTTGLTSQTYGGLGSGRLTALSAQGQISALDGYNSAINLASTRVGLVAASLSQLTTVKSQMSSALSNQTYGLTQTGLTTQQNYAKQQFASALAALGQSNGTDYLFGGRNTGSDPVASVDTILNGDAASGTAGLSAVIAERKGADGVGGTGNLSVGVNTTTATVGLSESSSGLTRANLGFILGSVTSSNAAAFGVTTTAAVDPTVTVGLAQQPKDGDIVRVTVNQPDGSQKLVDYVARTAPTPGSTTEFAIGASAAATTTNLQSLLTGSDVVAAQSGSPSPGAALTVTSQGTAGSASLSVGTPSDGDTVTIKLGMRDGTTTSITLTAKTSPDPTNPTQFAIGATPGATATNLQAALSTTLGTASSTTLAASSASLASQDFFAGSVSPGHGARRIGTVSYTDASGTAQTTTGFVTAPDGKTVNWYTGDDTSSDPRSTATVQAGSGYTVGIGMQANEPAFRSTLAALGAMASETFDVAGSGATAETARYSALSTRAQGLLTPKDGSQTLEQVTTEVSLADAALDSAKSQNTSTKNVLQNTVSTIETADPTSVATALMSLQTQLQASYQVTSMLSKMSLVNFL